MSGSPCGYGIRLVSGDAEERVSESVIAADEAFMTLCSFGFSSSSSSWFVVVVTS